MKKITLEEFRNTHVDYKGYVDGVPYVLVYKDGATISEPVDVEIDRSIPANITSDKFIGAWTSGMMAETSETREAVEIAFNEAVKDHEDWMYTIEVSGRKFYVAENGEQGFTAMLPSEY